MSQSDKVLSFFETNQEVPYSIRTVCKRLGMKKRCVHSICSDSKKLVKVHPTHCGSGKTSLNLFVCSSNNKWLEDKRV